MAFDKRRLRTLIKKPTLGKNQQTDGRIFKILSLRMAGIFAKHMIQSARIILLKKVKWCSLMVYMMRLTLRISIKAAMMSPNILMIVEEGSKKKYSISKMLRLVRLLS